MSGPSAKEIAERITIGEGGFEARHATLASLVEPETGEIIDEAIVTFFKAPQTFTGEDVVEISCHGSPVLLRRIIDICLKLDARMAEPGEFTLRALANGRLDLSQAEAVRDLIDSNSIAMTRQAVRQLRGEFSNQLQPLKDKLLDVIVVLESALEFVEDDLPDTQTEKLSEALCDVSETLGQLVSTYQAGRLLREGLKVALVGRPNVGKSSLFNALLGQERAIVTEIPGTTRDQIHETFTINNIPVQLMDTAGLRETIDTVETIGVERARQAMADADIVVVVIDSTTDLQAEDYEVLEATKEMDRVIAINKTDVGWVEGMVQRLSGVNARMVQISAKELVGLDLLRESVVAPFSTSDFESSGFLVSDARHHDLLRRAKEEIDGSLPLLRTGMSEEMVLVGLHNAIRYLGEITGETTTEDMLTRIFQTFCIGK